MDQLSFTAEIVDRQTLLNGTTVYSIEGSERGPADQDGWALSLDITLGGRAGTAVHEGDLTLERAGLLWIANVVAGRTSELLDDTTGEAIPETTLALARRPEPDTIAQWSSGQAVLRIGAEDCDLTLVLEP